MNLFFGGGKGKKRGAFPQNTHIISRNIHFYAGISSVFLDHKCPKSEFFFKLRKYFPQIAPIIQGTLLTFLPDSLVCF